MIGNIANRHKHEVRKRALLIELGESKMTLVTFDDDKGDDKGDI